MKGDYIMEINRIYDIVILYQYKNLQLGDNELIFNKIDFNKLIGDNDEQFNIIEVSESHIKFRDNIRRKVFIMKQVKPYSCGKYVYDIITE